MSIYLYTFVCMHVYICVYKMWDDGVRVESQERAVVRMMHFCNVILIYCSWSCLQSRGSWGGDGFSGEINVNIISVAVETMGVCKKRRGPNTEPWGTSCTVEQRVKGLTSVFSWLLWSCFVSLCVDVLQTMLCNKPTALLSAEISWAQPNTTLQLWK